MKAQFDYIWKLSLTLLGCYKPKLKSSTGRNKLQREMKALGGIYTTFISLLNITDHF